MQDDPATLAATPAPLAPSHAAPAAAFALARQEPAARPGRGRHRRALGLLAAGAAFTGVAFLAAPTGTSIETVEPVAPRRTGPAPAGGAVALAAATPALSEPVRAAIAAKPAADPFNSATFVPPVPAAPKPPKVVPVTAVVAPPPPPPVAPPLPFTFVGLLEKGGPRPAAFVARGDALLVVSAGDVLDGTYRVDAVSAREVAFTYLPLNQRQTLSPAGGAP